MEEHIRMLEKQNAKLANANLELRERNRRLDEENISLIQRNNELIKLESASSRQNERLRADIHKATGGFNTLEGLMKCNQFLEGENKALIRRNNQLRADIRQLTEELHFLRVAARKVVKFAWHFNYCKRRDYDITQPCQCNFKRALKDFWQAMGKDVKVIDNVHQTD